MTRTTPLALPASATDSAPPSSVALPAPLSLPAGLVLVAALALAAPVQGQTVHLLGGPSFPVSDFGDGADVGFHLAGGVAFEVADDLDVYGEGFWGQNGASEFDGTYRPYGAMAGLRYEFDLDDQPVDPYVFGGVGVMVQSLDVEGFDTDSESAFGYQTGVGIEFDLMDLEAFTEVRLLGASFDSESPGVDNSSLAFIGLVFGLSFELGGGGM